MNQNENIPPYGSNANQQKGGKRQSAISYFDNNNVGHIPDNEFLSVNQLAPFTPFVIKVRVTNKSEIREFKKANSMEMSKVFSVDLIDKEGNEISATFFGQSAEHWYPQIHENGVYIMREGQVKMVNSKFNKK